MIGIFGIYGFFLVSLGTTIVSLSAYTINKAIQKSSIMQERKKALLYLINGVHFVISVMVIAVVIHVFITR